MTKNNMGADEFAISSNTRSQSHQQGDPMAKQNLNFNPPSNSDRDRTSSIQSDTQPLRTDALLQDHHNNNNANSNNIMTYNNDYQNNQQQRFNANNLDYSVPSNSSINDMTGDMDNNNINSTRAPIYEDEVEVDVDVFPRDSPFKNTGSNMNRENLALHQKHQSEARERNLAGGTISLKTAFISLVKGNVGPGCLALPCVFGDDESVGILVSLGILLWVSSIALYVPALLLECQDNLRKQGKNVDTYELMALHTFGNMGEQCVKLFLVLLQVGICTVFLNFIGGAVVVGLDITALGFVDCVYVVSGFALLISLGRSVKAFAIFTKMATAAMLLALLMIFGFTIKHATLHWENSDHTRVKNLQYGFPASEASKFFALAFGNLAYTSATGVGLILPIAKDLKPEDRGKFLKTTRMALITAVVIFALLGVGCAIVFAGKKQDNQFCRNAKSITAELRDMDPPVGPDWLLAGLNGILILAVLLTFPLQLHPAVEVLERWIGIVPDEPKPKAKAKSINSRSTNSLSSLLSGVSSRRRGVQSGRALPAESIALLNGQPSSPQHILEDDDDGDDDVFMPETKKKKGANPIWWRILRAVVVVLTATAAAFVPQLTDIISLVGCITSGALGMVFPVVMDLKVRRQMKLPISCFRWTMGIFSILTGVFAITYGNVFTVLALINPESYANSTTTNTTMFTKTPYGMVEL